jgi:hypothetical protein
MCSSICINPEIIYRSIRLHVRIPAPPLPYLPYQSDPPMPTIISVIKIHENGIAKESGLTPTGGMISKPKTVPFEKLLAASVNATVVRLPHCEFNCSSNCRAGSWRVASSRMVAA